MPHLLIVDDDADARDLLVRFLAKAGHECDAVAGGDEALQRVLERVPDLILLDVLMPGMDGPTFLGILRSYARLRYVPVILLTAAPDSRKTRAAIELGVHAMLPKAMVTLEAIDHAIADALRPV